MPNIQLAVLVNLTGSPVQLSNTETPADNITVGANNVEVGGARVGYCDIPDCTSQQYFDQHHLTIQTQNQTYFIWKMDAGGGNTANVYCNTQPQFSTTLISGSPALKQDFNKALWITPSGLQMTDTDLIAKSQHYAGNISSTRSASATR